MAQRKTLTVITHSSLLCAHECPQLLPMSAYSDPAYCRLFDCNLRMEIGSPHALRLRSCHRLDEGHAEGPVTETRLL